MDNSVEYHYCSRYTRKPYLKALIGGILAAASACRFTSYINAIEDYLVLNVFGKPIGLPARAIWMNTTV